MRFYKNYNTYFIHWGDEYLGEYYNGNIAARYVPGPGVDEPLVQVDKFGNRTWLHADERGSTVAGSDASGANARIVLYDEYGKRGSGGSYRFSYTGQVHLLSDVYDYKSRNYNARLGRFLQADRIGYGAGMNLYAYVGGDPVNFTDPLGLEAEGGGDIVVTGHCDLLCRIVRAAKKALGAGNGSSTAAATSTASAANILRGSTARVPQGTTGRTSRKPRLPKAGQAEAGLPDCQINAPNVQASLDVGVFLGYGFGFTLGVDVDPDRFNVTAFATARAGEGLGLIGGAGIGLASSSPEAGLSKTRNVAVGVGPGGGSVSVPTGGGKMSVTSGVSAGPALGFEISETENLTKTAKLEAGGDPLCRDD